MKKTLLSAALSLVAGNALGAEPRKDAPLAAPAAAPAASAERKSDKSWLKRWFQHLKQGLSESAVQANYQKARVTAVAAVRGSEQESVSPDKPSWKGGAKTRKAAEMKRERQEFARAVDLILEGRTDEGVAALDAFEKAHPKSPLLPDVREARENARSLGAEAAPEAAKTEAPKTDAPKEAAKEAAKENPKAEEAR